MQNLPRDLARQLAKYTFSVCFAARASIKLWERYRDDDVFWCHVVEHVDGLYRDDVALGMLERWPAVARVVPRPFGRPCIWIGGLLTYGYHENGDLYTMERVRVPTEYVHGMASPSGARVATRLGGVWNIYSSEHNVIQRDLPRASMRWLTESELIYIINKELVVYDVDKAAKVRSWQIDECAMCHTSSLAIVTLNDRRIEVWAHDGQALWEQFPDDCVMAAKLYGTMLALLFSTRSLRLLDAKTGASVRTLPGTYGDIQVRGARLYVAGFDGYMHVIEGSEVVKRVRKFRLHVDISADGRTFFYSNANGCKCMTCNGATHVSALTVIQ